MIKIDNMATLKKLSTANLEKADIVIVPMTIWTDKYFDRLEELSGVVTNSKRPNIKSNQSRQFEAYYENLVAGLGDQMEGCKPGAAAEGELVRKLTPTIPTISDYKDPQ